MFKAEGLVQRYSTDTTIHFPGWTVAQGEHWLLTGPSGTGKTTLLHLLGGLLRPDGGSLFIAGKDMLSLSGAQRDAFRGKHIGIVFQQPHLIDTLTITENLLLAQYFAGNKQDKAHCRQLLSRLGLERPDAYPNTLSQGQMQRVSLARAIINKPSLLLADEPTASLDDENALQVLAMLQECAQQEGASLVIATHDSRIKERIHARFNLAKQ
jgi:ABC-type lipoprotein export system ATPase subunit